MKVQIFKSWTPSEQQNEINSGFAENNVIVHNITQSTGGGDTQWTTISIFYTEVGNINFEKVK
jgi:hypothetical protein